MMAIVQQTITEDVVKYSGVFSKLFRRTEFYISDEMSRNMSGKWLSGAMKV